MRDLVVKQLRKHRRLSALLKATACGFSPEKVVVLDYPINSKRRWTEDNPHRELYDIINQNVATYEAHLQSFLAFMEYFLNIPELRDASTSSTAPFWINGWMPALDGVALYSFIARNKPRYYIEVGSGNSTKFARQAIRDHELATRIISIDPCPRAEVASICDENIRQPVESVDLNIFDQLGCGDILYIDNSHRVLMNSDATTLLLDVLPKLKPGVLVEIHDVTLPYDYPDDWADRYYSEQYVLAAYLLARGSRFDIVLPSMFISRERALRTILSPLWEKEQMKNVETHGCSFWIRTK